LKFPFVDGMAKSMWSARGIDRAPAFDSSRCTGSRPVAGTGKSSSSTLFGLVKGHECPVISQGDDRRVQRLGAELIGGSQSRSDNCGDRWVVPCSVRPAQPFSRSACSTFKR
jgi:hypothetical protein